MSADEKLEEAMTEMVGEPIEDPVILLKVGKPGSDAKEPGRTPVGVIMMTGTNKVATRVEPWMLEAVYVGEAMLKRLRKQIEQSLLAQQLLESQERRLAASKARGIIFNMPPVPRDESKDN